MSEAKPSLAIIRFGTQTPGAKGRVLRAGALTAMLDDGQLRYICVNGVEVLRAICFLARDENWGTYAPQISGLKIKTSEEECAISYSATCGDAARSLSYDATISLSRKGVVRFAALCTPATDFITNRTGFIVLHPLKGVAGEKVTVEHVDGKTERAKFPAIINPVQPFRDIRALTHEVMPGLFANCRMEGDTFEMEDHRNWMDASFKTYVRPLAEPWPYVLKAGEAFEQSVTLTLQGKLPRAAAAASAARPVKVKIGAATKVKMPLICVALPAALAKATNEAQAFVAALGVRNFVAVVDGRARDYAAVLPHYAALAKACGARLTLEITLPGKAAPEDELRPIAAAAAKLDPAAVIVSPAADLKAVLPGTKGPDAPAPELIHAAARAAFPNAKLGAGTLSFFTELNRKRPPHKLLDFVTHTTSSIVHAADDLSVMETLETPPYISASVKAFIGKAKYHVGPGGIGARDNPYGASAAANPHNGRVCLASMDPRQRGLFGAAFTLGYASAFAGSGLEALTLGAAAGPLGAISLKLAEPQPWYDESGARLYPLFHVLRSLAAAQGMAIVLTECSDPAKVATLACRQEREVGREKGGPGANIWLANLTGQRQSISFAKELRDVRVSVLDERSFAPATRDPAFFDRAGLRKKRLAGLTLAPYAVAFIAAQAVASEITDALGWIGHFRRAGA